MDDDRVTSDDQDTKDDEVVKQRLEALVTLETDLAEAAKKFSDGFEGGREGVRNALVSVHRFLCATQIPHDLHGPIVALTVALEALDKGTVLPIVKPKKVRGTHYISEGEWIPRCIVAAALELRFHELKTPGTSAALKEATDWVWRRVKDWSVLPASGDPQTQEHRDKRNIQKWRSEMKERPSDESKVQLYLFLTGSTLGTSAENLLKAEPAQWGIAAKKYK